MMSRPALITLDDGGYRVETWKRKGSGNHKYGSIALHCAIAHILGEEDIRILKPPKGYPPLVDRYNINTVIEHETIHHVLADLFGHNSLFDDYQDDKDTLDDLLEYLPDGHWLRRRFLPCR